MSTRLRNVLAAAICSAITGAGLVTGIATGCSVYGGNVNGCTPTMSSTQQASCVGASGNKHCALCWQDYYDCGGGQLALGPPYNCGSDGASCS